jgi:hypothetical protein
MSDNTPPWRPGRRTALLLALTAAALPGLLRAEPAGGRIEPMLAALQPKPGDVRLGNDLRRECRRAGQMARCIELFDGLVERHPEVRSLRYNAALAYVDDLPGHSLLKQGSLSTRSIEHMDLLVESDPKDWLALYIRGLNNLYWPAWFRRTPQSIEDLSRCVEISERLPKGEVRPFHRLAYLALGDAQTMVGDVAAARATWRRGLGAHPGARDLTQRLAVPEAELPQFVAAARDIEKPVDTDLAFLWEAR